MLRAQFSIGKLIQICYLNVFTAEPSGPRGKWSHDVTGVFSHSTPTTPTFELLGFGFYELSDDLASPILIAFEWLIASGTQVAP